jgi:photosystem II stability/assembly factor-like uncharacterized protein
MSRYSKFLPDRNSCSRRAFVRGMALLGAVSVVPWATAFESPLQQPALRSDLLAKSPLLDVAFTGSRVVAVGLRGAILFSEDQGSSWTQAVVPVSTDLVAVAFPSQDKGWAVGHGGVVLHSADGGATWQKQLDGFEASHRAIEYYEQQAVASADFQVFLEREKMLLVEGETQPFLDLFFVDDLQGYVVGAFNRIFRTVDGGRTWQPLMHLTDNSGELHFYAVEGDGANIYLAGEQGKVWSLDVDQARFTPMNTPYDGTLFGLLALPQGGLLAYGMRGNLFYTSGPGHAWEQLKSPAEAGVTGALAMPDGGLLIVDQAGGIARSEAMGREFKTLAITDSMPYFAVALLPDDKVAVVGAVGVRIETV